MRNATLRASDSVDLVDEGGILTPGDARAKGARPWAPESPLAYADTLAKNQFLRQLQLERRRTDRSKSPLSIVQLRLDNRHAAQLGRIEELLELLRTSKRETDTLGCLGEDVVALVLPDTNEQGAQAFVRKIVARAEHLHLSSTTATYPDQSLDSLAAGSDALLGVDRVPRYGATDHKDDGYALKRPLDVAGSIRARPDQHQGNRAGAGTLLAPRAPFHHHRCAHR
jgi:GGDEF domain-containing protein